MRILKDVVVTLFGGCTSVFTAIVLFVVSGLLGFSIYGFTVCFIIPVGAIGSGFVASLGYYLGARLIGHKPSGLLLLNILAVSVLTYVLVNLLNYVALRTMHDPAAEQCSFLGFMNAEMQEASMTIRSRGGQTTDTGRLGMWGYGLAALQVVGFAFGGLIVFGMLAAIPFCEDCSRYFSRVGSQSRYFDDPDAFNHAFAEATKLMAENQCQEALERHAESGERKAKSSSSLSSTMKVRKCHGCEGYWVGIVAQKYSGNSWEDIQGAEFHQLHHDDLEMPYR